MNIDEAIKELEEPFWLITENHTPKYDEAAKLGIEALKWIRENRVGMAGHVIKQLPGETK